jgi:hypothetical protein
MEKCEVWSVMNKTDMPKGRKLIGNRWIFKEKRDGTFKARLVALGYSQIPGIDFMDNYSPVIADSSFRMILLMIQKLSLKAWSIDVETAFLNGNLDEEIYMKVPQGLGGSNNPADMGNKVLRLNKSIYGLVQAARQWHKRFEEEILKLGYLRNEVDPCVFLKQEGNAFCILCIYVDDGIIAGDEELMENTISGLNMVFHVKVQKSIRDFLGCEIHESIAGFVLCQTRIIDKMIKDNRISDLKEKYKTPSAPSFFVVRPNNQKEMIDEVKQKWYRATIGTLLYLVKLSRPDIANSVRELSKVMDGASPAHEKELKRVVNYLASEKDKGLKIEANRDPVWTIEAYSDSDFAGDKDDRKSITGYVVFVCGVAVSWKSKGQPNVTLSSTEAEYVALCETVREVKFISQLLETLNLIYPRPIKVKVDNIGAVFLSKNRTSGERTKHIDVKYHFIREQIDKGLIEIEFVRSEENSADIFTKNLGGELFAYHATKLTVKRA